MRYFAGHYGYLEYDLLSASLAEEESRSRCWEKKAKEGVEKVCGDPRALSDTVGGSKPKPSDARPKPFIKYISFINVFILKSLRKLFHFRESP